MSISEYSANLWRFTFLSSVVAPLELVAAVVLYKLDSFDPAPLPTHEFTQQAIPRAALQGLELVGFGQLLAPEDLAYDPKSKLIYTGCADGWIKRVTVNESAADSVVENWINTGGRPLGLALGRNNHEVIVADADKGLLKVNEGGVIKLLTNKSEGVEFRLTDAVDIARDGMIYFTDASYKYSFKEFIRDLLEGKPHGRFMSYNPSTKKTKVLVRDLYFPNGVAVSPDQDFVIFCETPMRRCKKYYLQGKRKGTVDKFIDDLPGMPDNIRYDGKGHYWIALAMARTLSWDLAQRCPFKRKGLAIMERYIGRRPQEEKNGGFLVVDEKGRAILHYYDPGLSLVSSGVEIGNHLYCGSIAYPYIIRFNLTQYPNI